MKNKGDSKNNATTINNLMSYFVNLKSSTRIELPREKMKYAIYCRKSTDEENKQVHSLKDQLNHCKDLAKKLHILPNKIEIIEESASAQKSNNRPRFTEMIRKFEKGEYQGFITWAPD